MVSSGFRKGLFRGVPGGLVLRAPEGPFFGVQAGLGVPKGRFLGPAFVVGDVLGGSKSYR